MNDWNKQIIDEFRGNKGRVGGPFEGLPLLLLHSKGRKSGKTYINPLAFQRIDKDTVAVFGSRGGSPTHPDWYRNVLTNPDVIVEEGVEAWEGTAYEAEGDERERIWTKQKADFPGFADYEEKTTRRIPVIVIKRS